MDARFAVPLWWAGAVWRGEGGRDRGPEKVLKAEEREMATAPRPQGHRPLHLLRAGRWGGALPEQPRLGPLRTASTPRGPQVAG